MTWYSMFQMFFVPFNYCFSILDNISIGGIVATQVIFGFVFMVIIIARLIPHAGSGLNLR